MLNFFVNFLMFYRRLLKKLRFFYFNILLFQQIFISVHLNDASYNFFIFCLILIRISIVCHILKNFIRLSSFACLICLLLFFLRLRKWCLWSARVDCLNFLGFSHYNCPFWFFLFCFIIKLNKTFDVIKYFLVELDSNILKSAFNFID